MTWKQLVVTLTSIDYSKVLVNDFGLLLPPGTGGFFEIANIEFQAPNSFQSQELKSSLGMAIIVFHLDRFNLLNLESRSGLQNYSECNKE
jgi:hypothetical protein